MQSIKIQKPIQLRDQVYNRVKEALLKGVYSQGERITEEKVAGHLGVSRTPVREALRSLEELRFLETPPSGGYYVPMLDEMNIVDFVDVRLLLEPRAMQKAVKSVTEEQLAALNSILSLVKSTATKDTDIFDFYSYVQEFWDCFWLMSNSAGLCACLRKLTEQYNYQYLCVISLDNLDVRLNIVDSLVELQKNIENRDSKKGVETIKAQLKYKKKVLLSVIDTINKKPS